MFEVPDFDRSIPARARRTAIRRARALGLALSATLALAPAPVLAIGFVRIDSSSFLQSSSTRDHTVSTLVVGTDYEGEGRWVSGGVGLQGNVYTIDWSTFTPEARELYIATSWELMPHHQITLGRRIFPWSVADRAWSLGLWSPRFVWDPLQPETVGMPGIFYSYRSKFWRLTLMYSPISIPERGPPLREENGKLVSRDPFNIPPYERILIQDVPTDIRYRLAMPPMNELLLHPSAAATVRWGEEQGAWAGASFGVLPAHQIDIATESYVNASAAAVDVNIYPRRVMHQVATAEAGYLSDIGSIFASVSVENPLPASAPAGWAVSRMGLSKIGAIGCELLWQSSLRLRGSYLLIDENLPPAPAAQAHSDLAQRSRFPTRRAWRIGAEFTGVRYFAGRLDITSDLETSSDWLSAGIAFRPGQPDPSARTGWLLYLGADVITSKTGKGWFGKYSGDSRGFGRIAYAF